MRKLLSLTASNFLSLGNVNVDLQDLTVLVGPNGAGKSNLLKLIQFLGDTARLDLVPAIEKHGGFRKILFRGKGQKAPRIKLGITGLMTGNSSENAPDEYDLIIWQHGLNQKQGHSIIRRSETFVFKRTKGRGRRITVQGSKVELIEPAPSGASKAAIKEVKLASTSSGLSTLRRLKGNGAEQIEQLAELLTTFRVFEIDTTKARAASRLDEKKQPKLESDASNLAAFLKWLKSQHEEVFKLLEEDLKVIVPSIESLRIENLSGANDNSYVVEFSEHGLQGFTQLSEASFGTVRALALLAMLHDPMPPHLTCVEEIDHGLHPHALDRIVERMRSASRRTQLLVVTHSPALANRLYPHELVVCEKDRVNGNSLIPAIDSDLVKEMSDASGLLPGELWFSGALGGVLATEEEYE